jgi:ketosteroid isomerase-like protein
MECPPQMMNKSRTEIIELTRLWLAAWNTHDIDGVMALLHDDVEFNNWTGATIVGKRALRLSWTPWFLDHGDFRFTEEDIFVDEIAQKALLRWQLEWPAPEINSARAREIRHGVDLIRFVDGKIIGKYVYSKDATVS